MSFRDYLKEDKMKISEVGNIVVLFMTKVDDVNFEIVHKIVYEELPNLASLQHNFEELQNDEEFGFGEDAKHLTVDIMRMDEYIDWFGDDELDL